MKSLTDLAGNLDVSTEQVLTSLRIVATRAGVGDLARWATLELEGYGTDDALPPHRIWGLSIEASLHNPMQGLAQNVQLGESAIDERWRERVTIHRCKDSIGQIEAVLAGIKVGEAMAVESPNLAQLINQGPMKSPGWQCIHASAKFSSVHLKEIVDRARQTALRLCLECEAKDLSLQIEADNASLAERTAWMNTLKTEALKIIVRDAWDMVREFFTSGAKASHGS